MGSVKIKWVEIR